MEIYKDILKICGMEDDFFIGEFVKINGGKILFIISRSHDIFYRNLYTIVRFVDSNAFEIVDIYLHDYDVCSEELIENFDVFVYLESIEKNFSRSSREVSELIYEATKKFRQKYLGE